jgi:hypothetical protein
MRLEKKYIMAIASVVALSMSATSFNKKNKPLTTDQKVEAVTVIDNRKHIAIKTAQASPVLEKNHGYMQASALLWNILTDASDIALNSVVSAPNVTNYSYQDNNWGWNWGVKAALGFHCADDWDFSLNFAYLQSTRHYYSSPSVDGTLNQTNLLSGIFQSYPYNTSTDASISTYQQKNHFVYYDGGLNFAREFFVSKKLSLKPIAGAKGVYFVQTSNIDYNYTTLDTSPGSLYIKNNYWGAGPQLGSGVRFGFTRHFSLDCQFDGALLWGQALNKENLEYTDLLVSTTENYNANRYQLVPNINFLAGFTFDANFAKNTKNIALFLGYENRYFFNNMNASNVTARQVGSTSMQGFNAGLTFSY